MAAKESTASPARRAGRAVLVAGYLAIVGLGFVWSWQPRLFWTVALPALVLFIVLAGFHLWRAICPLAFFGELGRKLNRGKQRKVPAWLESRYLMLPFVFLAAMLTLRLVATNGDGVWLSALLAGLALAALATNAVFTGKTWCNFVCPVGMVERIYTDPNPLARGENSQCARCTACKRSCPDIDQENNYWRELESGGRRAVTFAFPGLVLAFYGYFWLRHGDWEAYFDGRWTRLPASVELAFGDGFFFAPAVPALLAAVLTIAAASLASYALFRVVEGILARFVDDPERRRHIALSLAAFSAFALFYFFAGAPTLRRIPGATRSFAFVVPTLATLVLARRWRRSREGYVRERGAAKLLRNWPFDTPAPSDPAEAYALVKATEQAREKVIAGYEKTLGEILSEGIVREGERRLLDELRKQFGITPREHEQVVARLAEEQRLLLEAGDDGGVESRLQLESYQAALAEAMIRKAPAHEIEELRKAFDIGEAAHARLLEVVRGGSGPLLARARRHLDDALAQQADRRAIEAGPAHEARALLAYLLARSEERAVGRVLEVFETIGGEDEAEMLRLLRPALLSAEPASRRAALRQLPDACPGCEALIPDFSRLLLGDAAGSIEAGMELAATSRAAAASDPYLRATALWLLATTGDEEERSAVLSAACADESELVRATAEALARPRSTDANGEPRYIDRGPVERMQFLRRVPLLAELDPGDLEELGAFAREETIAAPGTICRQGVPDTGDLFVLLEGMAAVRIRRQEDDPGSEREVAVLGPGEVVGELSLLDGSPRSATVAPKGDEVRLLRIPGPAFRAVLLHRQRVAQALLLTLTERVRNLSSRIAAAGE